jgi:hypothetical protein
MASTTPVLPDFKMDDTGIPSSIGGDMDRFAKELLDSIPDECTFTTELAKKYLLTSRDAYLIKQSINELVVVEREILKQIESRGFTREQISKRKGRYYKYNIFERTVEFPGFPDLEVELKHDIDYRKVDIIQFHFPEMFPLVIVRGDDDD